jgi:lipoate synthase
MSNDAKIKREAVTAYVKPQQFERLQQIKDEEGFRSMSHLVDRALVEFEAKRKKP